MKHAWIFGVGLLALLAPLATSVAAGQAPGAAAMTTEDGKLTAFLDAQFAEELKQKPQLATRLGSKEGQDRLNDISDAAEARALAWRRASVALGTRQMPPSSGAARW